MLEFDNTSPLKTVKTINPSSGDTVLYILRQIKSGILIGPQVFFLNSVFFGWWDIPFTIVGASSSGAPATFLNYLRGAAAASTSNRFPPRSAVLRPNSTLQGMFNSATSTMSLFSIANGDTRRSTCRWGSLGFIGVNVVEI